MLGVYECLSLSVNGGPPILGAGVNVHMLVVLVLPMLLYHSAWNWNDFDHYLH